MALFSKNTLDRPQDSLPLFKESTLSQHEYFQDESRTPKEGPSASSKRGACGLDAQVIDVRFVLDKVSPGKVSSVTDLDKGEFQSTKSHEWLSRDALQKSPLERAQTRGLRTRSHKTSKVESLNRRTG